MVNHMDKTSLDHLPAGRQKAKVLDKQKWRDIAPKACTGVVFQEQAVGPAPGNVSLFPKNSISEEA